MQTVTEAVTASGGAITRGEKSESVLFLQRFLIARGYSVGEDGADGEYGDDTFGAVSRYKSAHGLDPDNPRVAKTSAAVMDADVLPTDGAAPVTPSKPAMILALEPLIGVTEIPGTRANPKIMAMVGVVAASDPMHANLPAIYRNDDTPWCGLGVAYAAVKAGFDAVRAPLWALNWSKWGDAADGPRWGAVAVKTRAGGGHVTLVYGVSAGGGEVYCLGGNQSNSISIARYRRADFNWYRRPPGVVLPPAPVMRWSGGAAVVTEA